MEIKRDSGGGRIPELMVRKEIGHPPLNRKYGEIICTIPSSEEERLSVPLPNVRLDENAFIGLFVANPDEESFYGLNAPPPETLKLEFVPKGFFSRMFH